MHVYEGFRRERTVFLGENDDIWVGFWKIWTVSEDMTAILGIIDVILDNISAILETIRERFSCFSPLISHF